MEHVYKTKYGRWLVPRENIKDSGSVENVQNFVDGTEFSGFWDWSRINVANEQKFGIKN